VFGSSFSVFRDFGVSAATAAAAPAPAPLEAGHKSNSSSGAALHTSPSVLKQISPSSGMDVNASTGTKPRNRSDRPYSMGLSKHLYLPHVLSGYAKNPMCWHVSDPRRRYFQLAFNVLFLCGIAYIGYRVYHTISADIDNKAVEYSAGVPAAARARRVL
jgi:hypothetical protein